MINFKNHNIKEGFSFIEIVIAISIVGIILTALFNLQNTIFNTAARDHSRIIRIFNLKNIFFDQEINKKIFQAKQIKQNIDDPRTVITYNLLKPKDKSELKKFKNLNILQATGTWQLFNRDFQEELASLIFKVDEKQGKDNAKK